MPMRGGSDKITWICESPGPTSAGKPPKSEAKIPLVHTKSLISWSRWGLRRGRATCRTRADVYRTNIAVGITYDSRSDEFRHSANQG